MSQKRDTELLLSSKVSLIRDNTDTITSAVGLMEKKKKKRDLRPFDTNNLRGYLIP